MIKSDSMDRMKLFRRELNFRDLGGYETTEHRKIRHGLFYRSSNLSWMNDDERKAFQNLGIQCILDLRTKEESGNDPDPVFAGITNVRHSGVVSRGGEEIDFSPKGMAKIGADGKNQYERLMKYYENMPFDNEALHVLIRLIRNDDLPVCFHCATGKDRTGIAAMIVLLLLGVDEETVLQDYLLSNSYRQKVIEKMFAENIKQTEDPYGNKLLMMRAGVTEETGRNVLSAIWKRYGTYDSYFAQEYDLKPDEIRNLRERYTI